MNAFVALLVFASFAIVASKYENGPTKKKMLMLTNYHRSQHHAAPLQYDPYMEQLAQAHAEALAVGKKSYQLNQRETMHFNRDGQSIMGGYHDENYEIAAEKPIGKWYNQIHNYDFANPGSSTNGKNFDHFTQMVWTTTTKVGYGIFCVSDDRGHGCIFVANYDPPGNNFRKGVRKTVYATHVLQHT